jgi:hypothetical protein
MKRISFPKAVGGVLEPVGFEKTATRGLWRRQCGDYLDGIELQISKFFDRITVNVWVRDDVSAAILAKIHPPDREPGIEVPVSLRIGKIVNGPKSLDKWWLRSDPNGPAEIAEMLKTGVLPFLDRVHSLEGMTAYLEMNVVNWDDRLNLAVALYRLGEKERALKVLDESTPKWWSREKPHLVTRIEHLRRIIAA